MEDIERPKQSIKLIANSIYSVYSTGFDSCRVGDKSNCELATLKTDGKGLSKRVRLYFANNKFLFD